MKSESKTTDHIARQLANNDALLDIRSQLKNETGDSRLSYPALADKHVERAMADEMERQLKLGREGGSVRGLGLVYRRVAATVTTPYPVLDMLAVRKEGNRVKKDHEHVITRSVSLPTLVGSELGIAWVIVALMFTTDPNAAPRLATAAANAAGAMPSDEWVSEPSEQDIARLVGAFAVASRTIRQLAGQVAHEQDMKSWREIRPEAQFQLWRADLVTPAKKSFDAGGMGAVILKHALMGPDTRAKQLGKNGLSRDEVFYRLWRHSFENLISAPPLVKI